MCSSGTDFGRGEDDEDSEEVEAREAGDAVTKKTTSDALDDAHHASTLGALVRELRVDGKVVPTGIFNLFDEARDVVTKKTTSTARDDVRRALDGSRHALARAYSAHVCELAALARAVILPYFSEHRLTYKLSTSVDTWYIENERGRSIRDEALPAHVHAVLDFPVASTCLGFHLEEIKPTDWIAQKSSKKSSRKSK